ncbi:hypothetical protein EYZ11_004877 [Aspergillus tanneri]|uniref:Uncharacterized protein n=1 Tax=Aspergillus tanneri TaxID=1220188 RepID=A0A4V3UPT3_9EURO|nr:hypothetical protein EYZ11_004877 [Aspergillus tanneri]
MYDRSVLDYATNEQTPNSCAALEVCLFYGE